MLYRNHTHYEAPTTVVNQISSLEFNHDPKKLFDLYLFGTLKDYIKIVEKLDFVDGTRKYKKLQER